MPLIGKGYSLWPSGIPHILLWRSSLMFLRYATRRRTSADPRPSPPDTVDARKPWTKGCPPTEREALADVLRFSHGFRLSALVQNRKRLRHGTEYVIVDDSPWPEYRRPRGWLGFHFGCIACPSEPAGDLRVIPPMPSFARDLVSLLSFSGGSLADSNTSFFFFVPLCHGSSLRSTRIWPFASTLGDFRMRIRAYVTVPIFSPSTAPLN